MTIQIPSQSTTTTVTNITLAVHDALYIGRGIQVASSGATAVATTAQGDNDMILDGTAAGDAGFSIGPNSSLVIGSTGLVTADRIGLYWFGGSTGYLLNEGRIFAGGIAILGAATQDLTIINKGAMRSGVGNYLGQNATIQFDQAGTKIIDNAGTIEALQSGAPAIRSNHAASVERIANSGVIKGDIFLGGGDDRYDGSTGRLIGSLSGEGGSDVLIGGAAADRINGGDGADALTGGLGKDLLTGGTGADDFIFATPAQSRGATCDTIQDFSRAQGDDIVLSAIDANTKTAGNQAFAFIGTTAFSGKAGELRVQKVGTDVHIQADTDGNRTVDLLIVSNVPVSFVKGDFVL